MNFKHKFHLVDPSIWPFLISVAAIFFTFGMVMYMHKYAHSIFLLSIGLTLIILISACWWRDVVREATYKGHHTYQVQQGIRLGVLLFIVSELILFFGFFWAYIHFCGCPKFFLQRVWPQVPLQYLLPSQISFLKSAILICAASCLTWTHSALLSGARNKALIALGLVLTFVSFFAYNLGLEWQATILCVRHGIYGSVYYMTMGLYALHLFLATFGLLFFGLHWYASRFRPHLAVYFEAAIFYWHFVDVVWLFLFVCLYWWPLGQEIVEIKVYL